MRYKLKPGARILVNDTCSAIYCIGRKGVVVKSTPHNPKAANKKGPGYLVRLEPFDENESGYFFEASVDLIE